MAQTNVQKLAAVKAKIEELTKQLPELEAAAANEVDPAKVVEGVSVEFDYGKKPNVKTLLGLVLGVKAPEDGKGGVQARVAVGEGFDAQTLTIYVAQVTKIIVEPSTEALPAEGGEAE